LAAAAKIPLPAMILSGQLWGKIFKEEQMKGYTAEL